MRLSTFALALGTGIAALLPVLSSAQAAQVLNRPNDAEPESLDPQKTASLFPLGIDTDMFMGLLTLDADAKPVPGVAESWDVTPDKKIWTFHLRHDTKWSNGDPVTADDFVYSFRRLVDPKTAAADPSYLKDAVNYEAILSGKEKDLTKLGVEALDHYTLKLTLAEPRVVMPLLLAQPALFPLPRATIEKWGDQWTKPEHIVSNGPYVMTNWVPQAEIDLKKNPNFYDAATVKIDQVRWLDASDRQAALKRFQGGEFDWVSVPRSHIAWAKQNMADQLHTALDKSSRFMPFNMAKGVLAQDIRLREALNLAIDRDILCTKLDPRGEQPAYGINPPVLSDYTPQSMPMKEMSQADRTARAKELLKEAGYGPDHPLKLTVSYTTDDNTRQILLGIRSMLQPLGVDLTLDNMEWQVYVHLIQSRNFDLGMMGASGTYDDYENGLDNYRSDAGEFNWGGYNSPKFDDLFHRGATATDAETRRKLMEEAERTVLADYAVIPLSFDALNRLVSPKLVGLRDNQPMPQSRHLSFKEGSAG
ncbi:MAG TPA: peptide ABC transporter substrate-binding protein [Aliidongia sp.]|nr:peptide ABC transporter substrate-binding protein [Aliidongia sp.]